MMAAWHNKKDKLFGKDNSFSGKEKAEYRGESLEAGSLAWEAGRLIKNREAVSLPDLFYLMVNPPSITRLWPVTMAAPVLHRYAMTEATSSGSANRPEGISCLRASPCGPSQAL